MIAALALAGALPASLLAAPAVPASATTPTVAPALTAPADGAAFGPDSLLRWGAVAGAVGYEVQIATDPSFGSIVYDLHTAGRSAVPATQLPAGTLYWHVRATDLSNNAGPASATRSIVTVAADAPTPLTPQDGDQKTFPDDPPVFSWTAVDGVKSYLLEVDDAADFVNPTTYKTANTSFTLTTPQTFGQTYWWRVSAVLVSGQSTPTTSPRSYSIGWASQPSLLTPTQGQTVADTVFHWSTVPGAATYTLDVSPNIAFANNPVLHVEKLTSTQYSPPTTLDNGTYFWRVQAVDAAGDTGAWSDTGTFTRAWVAQGVPERPTLLTPVWSPGGPIPHVNGDLGLSWTPVHHASSYEIEISTDPNFSPGLSAQCYTNHTAFQPYVRKAPSSEGSCGIDKLSTGVAYYWHVRGIDDPGEVLGVWSDAATGATWQFVLDPPMPTPTGPTPLYPDAVTPAPELGAGLQWSSVPGAEKYQVVLQRPDGSLTSPITTYGTSWSPLTRLTPAGVYGWSVRAVFGNGDVSAAPAIGWPSFSTPAAGTASAVSITSPAAGAASDRMPDMAWTAVPAVSGTSPVTYDVHASINGFDQVLASGLPYASFTSTGVPLPPGTYTWYVVPHNSTVTAPSASSTFTVLDIQPSATLAPSDYLTPTCVAPDPCSDTPTFSWKRVDEAGWYIVSAALDPHFTNVVRQWGTAYTSFTPRESLVDNQAGQSYYWFVRPCIDSTATRCGPSPQNDVAQQNAAKFQKFSAPVTGLSPATGSSPVADQVTFTWDDYLDTDVAVGAQQEAEQYVVQVSTKQDFSTTLDTATVDQTTYTAGSKTYPEGPIYWRVQAVDGSGNHLTWSAPQQLLKQSPAPTPTDPVGGTVETGLPTLQWQPLADAATYTVELYQNGDTSYSSANRVASQVTAYTSWAPVQGLPSGLYTWRVRRVDGGGQPGQWSSGGLFRLQADAPTLLGPVEGAALSGADLVFVWQPSSAQKIAQYRWQLSNSSGFGAPTSATTVNHAWAPVNTVNDGTWYWRVQVLDGANNVLATSSARSFTLDTTAPRVTSTVKATSVPIRSSFPVTFSEPVLHVSGTTLTLAAGPTVVPAKVSGTGSTSVLTPLGPLTPGQHYTLRATSGITDRNGNPLVAWTAGFRADTQVSVGSPALVERWDHDVAAGASGSAFDIADSAGAAAGFTFAGTAASLLGVRRPDGGYADVTVDGTRRTRVSFFAPTTRYRQAVWTVRGLANGTHTVRVQVVGVRPPGSSGTAVAVDALQVGSTLHEERTAAESFARTGQGDDWTPFATRGDNGGGPTFAATLRGTTLYVYGLRSPSAGKVAITLDGVRVATIDERATTAQPTAMLWSSRTLADTVHTLRLTVLGTATGAGSTVGIASVRTDLPQRPSAPAAARPGVSPRCYLKCLGRGRGP
ncbi:MAG: Ig-like domain-containing protein, partial [Jatrophihabitans sp.]|uniref:Ig-like domain-containing protein n=1 Tax=Jatrophihabitans sp. TaxID=1932789 RepID=UPI003F7EB4CA